MTGEREWAPLHAAPYTKDEKAALEAWARKIDLLLDAPTMVEVLVDPASPYRLGVRATLYLDGDEEVAVLAVVRFDRMPPERPIRGIARDLARRLGRALLKEGGRS